MNNNKKKELDELQKWFSNEISKLRKEKLQIFYKFDKRKKLILEKKILEKITMDE